MVVEERLRSKFLYKIEIIGIKYIPFIIAIMYFIDTILDAFKVDIGILSHLFGMSFLPWCFLLLSSYVFKFCLFHRIPLYYIALNHVISLIDYYIGIPLELEPWVVLHILIVFVFSAWAVVEHQKENKNVEHTKETSI
jgi:hypothetical protein